MKRWSFFAVVLLSLGGILLWGFSSYRTLLLQTGYLAPLPTTDTPEVVSNLQPEDFPLSPSISSTTPEKVSFTATSSVKAVAEQKPTKPSLSEAQKLAAAEQAAKELEEAVKSLEANLSSFQEKKLAELAARGTPLTPPRTDADFKAATDRARTAVVNILCESQSGGPINPISASGVIVDSRGIVLTNAHVAQYFLLKDYIVPDFINCTIRTGSPAKNAYRAKLLYISKPWIEKNAKAIIEESPLGTGESDFAFLLITETIAQGETLPVSFPALPLAIERTPPVGENIILSGYPSGFLGGITVQTGLYQLTSVGPISELYTYDDTHVDVIEVKGSLLSQRGSSGGALVDADGTLLGIIATAELDHKTTEERSVRAITIGHINRKLETEIGLTLQKFFEKNPYAVATAFARDLLPGLRNTLIDAIQPN